MMTHPPSSPPPPPPPPPDTKPSGPSGPGRTVALTDNLLALLDRVIDPMPEAIEEALTAIRGLAKEIDSLTVAKSKQGDRLWSLEADAYTALEAVEHLARLIEEKYR